MCHVCVVCVHVCMHVCPSTGHLEWLYLFFFFLVIANPRMEVEGHETLAFSVAILTVLYGTYV